jgi:TRAP-type transport system periplasmic protein
MRWRSLVGLALAAATAAAAAGCGGGDVGANKAGRSSAAVVLRMADGYNPGLELEPAVAYFARRVRELSNGKLRIRVVDNWAGNTPGFEQKIVRDLAAGKADVAWVGTRVFDTLGVNSFRALTAPMLIDSYSLERAVVASDIPGQMLNGLDKLGVSGLGVLAGGLRKPIALQRPLLRPADWRGRRFSVIRSRGQTAAIRALGARTTDIWGSARQDAAGEGKVDGFEMHYFLWSLVIDPSVVPYVAANVNLWPETVALLANPDRLSKLSRSQREWLDQAATEAAARSTSLFADESRLVASLCSQGARFNDASADDLAALSGAFAPTYATLERDPQTKDFIERIEKLKATTRPEAAASIPPRCAGPAPRPPAPAAGQTDSSVLNGVYRVTLTDTELKAAGSVAAFSRPSYGGLITLTLRNGRYRFQPGTPPKCAGTYTVSGSTIRFRFRPAATYCQGVVTARWSLAGGQLRLHVVSSTNPYDQVVWGGKPWRKIG